MAEITADRVYETSTTTGTGAYTLAGAVAGYRAFSAVCANGDTVRCFIEEVDASGVPSGGWEVGIYTWGTGGTLARTTVEASSNSNAAVSWSAGTRRVGLGVTASRAALLAYLSSTYSDASPNNSVSVKSIQAAGATTDTDLVLSPAAAGALLAQIPDGSSAGGNKRGSMAVDWQMSRGNANQVASGDRTVVGGGRDNRSSGAQSTVAGGRANFASGNWATASGYTCEASAEGAVSMGSQNIANAGIGCTAFGRLNTASAEGAFVAGAFNLADGLYSVSFGQQATTRTLRGAMARASGAFTVAGDAQARSVVFWRGTNSATPARLNADNDTSGTANQLTLPSGSAAYFHGSLVARNNATGDCASWTVAGLAKNISDTVTIVGTPAITQNFADSGATAWVLAVAADATNAAIAFNVTGAASTNIRWVSHIETVEVVG